MKNQVIIVGEKETGKVLRMRTIVNKQTGEESQVGTVMVEQKSLTNLSGLGRVSKRTAFITLQEDAIEFLGDSLVAGAPFPQAGKIVITETLKPYKWVDAEGNERVQEPKINPSTNEVITYQGSPVYRNSEFTTDLDAQDVLLKDVAMASSEAAE